MLISSLHIFPRRPRADHPRSLSRSRRSPQPLRTRRSPPPTPPPPPPPRHPPPQRPRERDSQRDGQRQSGPRGPHGRHVATGSNVVRLGAVAPAARGSVAQSPAAARAPQQPRHPPPQRLLAARSVTVARGSVAVAAAQSRAPQQPRQAPRPASDSSEGHGGGPGHRRFTDTQWNQLSEEQRAFVRADGKRKGQQRRRSRASEAAGADLLEEGQELQQQQELQPESQPPPQQGSDASRQEEQQQSEPQPPSGPPPPHLLPQPQPQAPQGSSQQEEQQPVAAAASGTGGSSSSGHAAGDHNPVLPISNAFQQLKKGAQQALARQKALSSTQPKSVGAKGKGKGGGASLKRRRLGGSLSEGLLRGRPERRW